MTGDCLDDLKDDITDESNNDYHDFVTRLHWMCLYMQLSDPVIHVPESSHHPYQYFSKACHYCLDGFAQEGQVC